MGSRRVGWTNETGMSGKGTAKMVERKLKPLDRDLPQDESNTYRLYLELDFYTVQA